VKIYETNQPLSLDIENFAVEVCYINVMHKWLSDLRRWAWLVISGWLQYAGAGITGLVWVVVEKIRERPLSWKILGYTAIIFLLFAFFNAWRTESTSHTKTKHSLETLQRLQDSKNPLIKVRFELDRSWEGDSVLAIVHNGGAVADVRVPLRFSGPIARKPSHDVFALWTHTEKIGTMIPKGGDYKLRIARYVINGFAGQWHFFFVTEKGGAEIPAMYSYLLATPGVEAPETFVEISIYTNPDSEIGVQRFKLTFRGPNDYSVVEL
jgi:hypothetical protein